VVLLIFVTALGAKNYDDGPTRRYENSDEMYNLFDTISALDGGTDGQKKYSINIACRDYDV